MGSWDAYKKSKNAKQKMRVHTLKLLRSLILLNLNRHLSALWKKYTNVLSLSSAVCNSQSVTWLNPFTSSPTKVPINHCAKWFHFIRSMLRITTLVLAVVFSPASSENLCVPCHLIRESYLPVQYMKV